MPETKEQFRLRKDDDPLGVFNILKLMRATVRHGEFHALFLLPHFIIPVYALYRLLARFDQWPDQSWQELGQLLLALIQGLAIGSALVLGRMRWSTAGRALMGRRKAGIASPGEERAQKKIQLGFAISVYVFFATIIWILLPPADGPKAAAIKTTARRWGFTPTARSSHADTAGFVEWFWPAKGKNKGGFFAWAG